ncbi:MAG: hypothetical protein GY713_14410, partial [Actinomycetia bacterium]|nr:hypothetical protein [Actinomycetes bacterium]
MVGFSERLPPEQAAMVSDFVATLQAAILEKLGDIEPAIFPTGDGAIVCVYADDASEMSDLASIPLELAIALLRLTEAKDYDLKLAINASSHESIIDISAIDTVHGSAIQIGDGINLAERALNFAEPREVVSTDTYYMALRASGDASSLDFKVQRNVFVKHMRALDLYIYNPAESEIPAVGTPREAADPDHRRYAYFPPMKQVTLDRFRDIGLASDAMETVEYVYETIAAVNAGKKFISWAPVRDVLSAVRPDVGDETLILSRSDYAGHFWTHSDADRFIRTLERRGFNQTRLFIYDAESDEPIAPSGLVSKLVLLH